MTDKMRLERGSGWQGTFAGAIAFTAGSMLANGDPVEDVTVTTYEGATTGDLTFADVETVTVGGKSIDIEDIDVFEVEC